MKASILIFVFLGLMFRCSYRAHADVRMPMPYAPEVHWLAGASFGACRHGGPVLGLDNVFPINDGMAFSAGTTLWGATALLRNNWDWHVRMEYNRGAFGAGIGAAYLQNIDGANSSHAEYSLLLFWRPGHGQSVDGLFDPKRFGAAVEHISNAGTVPGNCGSQAALVDWRAR